MTEAKARKAVYCRSMLMFETDWPMCEVCGLRGKDSWHHRKNRSKGGLWEPDNGLAVCGDGTRGCHGALTNTNGRRNEYEVNGWIVPSWKNPADVAVLHAALGWVFLLPGGGWTFTIGPTPS